MQVKLTLCALILTTTACNFTGYGDSQAPVIQPGATARTEARPDAGREVNTAGQQAAQSRSVEMRNPEVVPPLPPLTSAQLAPCPDNEVSRLIVTGDFDRAKALLDEDLRLTSDDTQRSCILTTMGMLAALPDSSLYDPDQAQDYQALARVNGVVKKGGLALQMLDKSLSNLIALQRQLRALDGDNDQLKEQLDAKDLALQKLKKLTLGNP